MAEQTAAASGSSSKDAWVISVQHNLKQLAKAKESERRRSGTIFRVPPHLLRWFSPEHFAPDFLSMGLFHRRGTKDSLHRSGHKFKLAMASAFLETIQMKEDQWDELCSLVVENHEEMQNLYGGAEELFEEFQSEVVVKYALTLDAICLTTYVCGYLFDRPGLDFPFPLFRETYQSYTGASGNIVLYDMVKLENQIPLSLMRNVLTVLLNETGKAQYLDAGALLNEICLHLVLFLSSMLPGFNGEKLRPALELISFPDCDHILGCLSRVMQGSAPSQDSPKDTCCFPQRRGPPKPCHIPPCCEGGRVSQWFERRRQRKNSRYAGGKISLPSAIKLRMSGIKFVGHGRGCVDLMPTFDAGIFKATLTIPRFFIGDDTKLLWANYIAYETARCNEGAPFLSLLKFMDQLVDTNDDVWLLRRGRHPVIHENLMGTDDDVAELFNSILRNIVVEDSAPWINLRREIHSYYKQKMRRMYVEFMSTNCGKPWVAVSLGAATVLLVMTFLQTIYALLAYY